MSEKVLNKVNNDIFSYDTEGGVFKMSRVMPVEIHHVTTGAGTSGYMLTSTGNGWTWTDPSTLDSGVSLTSGTGVSITNDIISIGQSVGTTDNVTFNSLDANVSKTSNLSISSTTRVEVSATEYMGLVSQSNFDIVSNSGSMGIYVQSGDIDIYAQNINFRDGAGTVLANKTSFTNWDTSYSWGDHSVAGYLNNVSISAPVPNQFITYNGTNWINVNPDTDDISEGPGNLYYTDERVDTRIALASLGDLNNVNVTTPNTGEILSYNGTNWVSGGIVFDSNLSVWNEDTPKTYSSGLEGEVLVSQGPNKPPKWEPMTGGGGGGNPVYAYVYLNSGWKTLTTSDFTDEYNLYWTVDYNNVNGMSQTPPWTAVSVPDGIISSLTNNTDVTFTIPQGESGVYHVDVYAYFQHTGYGAPNLYNVALQLYSSTRGPLVRGFLQNYLRSDNETGLSNYSPTVSFTNLFTAGEVLSVRVFIGANRNRVHQFAMSLYKIPMPVSSGGNLVYAYVYLNSGWKTLTTSDFTDEYNLYWTVDYNNVNGMSQTPPWTAVSVPDGIISSLTNNTDVTFTIPQGESGVYHVDVYAYFQHTGYGAPNLYNVDMQLYSSTRGPLVRGFLQNYLRSDNETGLSNYSPTVSFTNLFTAGEVLSVRVSIGANRNRVHQFAMSLLKLA